MFCVREAGTELAGHVLETPSILEWPQCGKQLRPGESARRL